MTVHKSEAVLSGITPDLAMAGVVLSRSAEFATADDEIVSGDTLQMVPIPKNAKILKLEVYYSALPAGTTGSDIGYGGDPDAFMVGVNMTAANVKIWPAVKIATHTENTFAATAGFLHTFTADDTIDIAFTKLATKIPTGQHVKMNIYYKMIGTLKDET